MHSFTRIEVSLSFFIIPFTQSPPALHPSSNQEYKKSLGSRVLLRIPLEIGYSMTDHYEISILFDHISNAYLADPNEGLDTLGLRFGYRF
jgi:hypothetical protein